MAAYLLVIATEFDVEDVSGDTGFVVGTPSIMRFREELAAGRGGGEGDPVRALRTTGEGPVWPW